MDTKSTMSLSNDVYMATDVFEREVTRIWHGSWAYLAHESEIPEPGDYVRKQLGRTPLIVSRDLDGVIHVLHNSCAHRGTLVCQAAAGSSSSFRCAYHGWTYRNDGRLTGIPYGDGYPEGYREASEGLARVSWVDIRRGFIFASLGDPGVSLSEHLGHAAPLIDQFSDLSPTGQIALRAGSTACRIDANWKIWAENAVDNYHVSVVHRSAVMAQDAEGRRRTAAQSKATSLAVARALGHGHTQLDFSAQHAISGSVFAGASQNDSLDRAREAYRAAMQEAHGNERADFLLSAAGPVHFFVFPNLFIRAPQELRVIEPLGPRLSVQREYVALLEDVPEELNHERVRRHEQAYGPAGAFMADDIELWERTQRGVDGDPHGAHTLARGLHRETIADAQEGDEIRESHVTDEVGQRGFWQYYFDVMR